MIAAAWNADRTPRGFLDRHPTGVRFSALPEPLKEEALHRLRRWAATAFGSLDAVFSERHSLELRRLHLPGRGGALMPDMTENALLTDLGRRLVNGSLSDAAIQQATEATPNLAILPWVNVVKIGGQSIMDRGRHAVGPVVDEIVANLHRHKMILGTGAGTRARHVYSLAIDLGLPVGVLTVLGTAVAWQNAQMLQYLLAQHGIAFLEPDGFASLPHYLMERGAVICQGMPPYKLWEANPSVGRIPPQRTDTGCFLIAEVFGARKMIYVKDEDGLFTADPKKDPGATHIPRISVQDLLARDLNDLVVERAVLDLMLNARHIKRDPVRQRTQAGPVDGRAGWRAGGNDHLQCRRPTGRARGMNPNQGGAQHVVSRLMRESLMDKTVIAGTESPVRAILPTLNVIEIGGMSIMDRGHTSVLPVLDEIVANQERYTQVIGVGPGVRARHILSVGLDLGLPTGALATLAAKSSAQNAYMVSCLLASHGFVYLEAPFIVQLLPAMLAAARGAVFNGIPPTTCGSIHRRWARSRRTAATREPIWWERCLARGWSSW